MTDTVILNRTVTLHTSTGEQIELKMSGYNVVSRLESIQTDGYSVPGDEKITWFRIDKIEVSGPPL